LKVRRGVGDVGRTEMSLWFYIVLVIPWVIQCYQQLQVFFAHVNLLPFKRLRLIRSRRFPKADGEPVPAVDLDDGHSQLDQFFFTELRAGCLELLVRRMALGDQRDGFRSPQSGALALSIERRFAPRAQGVELLFAFAERARVLGVHVNAVGLRLP
jgi:hypothetical protein